MERNISWAKWGYKKYNRIANARWEVTAKHRKEMKGQMGSGTALAGVGWGEK